MNLSRMRIKSGYRGRFPLYSLWKHATTTMDLKKLFTEERAVSPVIGVILMVAITVILAAVIGAFVLGIGGDQNATPSASITLDNTSDTEVDIIHRGGETLNQDDIILNAGGDTNSTPFDQDTLSSGQTVTAIVDPLDDGDEITFVHEPSGGIIASTTA